MHYCVQALLLAYGPILYSALLLMVAPVVATFVLVGVADANPYFDLTLNAVFHKQQLLI